MPVAKPFVFFAKADIACSDQEVAQMRFRLSRELQSNFNYMSNCDLEKANEPVIVLFTKLDIGTVRHGLSQATTAQTSLCSPNSYSSARSQESEEDYRKLKLLKKTIEETRDVANPRFVILCNTLQPWNWVFVLLRSYARLAVGLHRLFPAAAQIQADRQLHSRAKVMCIDDHTASPETVRRLRQKMVVLLKPFLDFLAEDDDDSRDAEDCIPLLFVRTSTQLLCERCILEPVSDLDDLSPVEYQRFLLARDRLYEIHKILRPRILVICNWVDPTEFVFVLLQSYSKHFSGISSTFPDKPIYCWKNRRLPLPSDPSITDYCYNSGCSQRGLVLDRLKLCPACQIVKYCCARCQQQDWPNHYNFCSRLAEGQLKHHCAVQPPVPVMHISPRSKHYV